jgi:cytochrome c oxidase subunit 2
MVQASPLLERLWMTVLRSVSARLILALGALAAPVAGAALAGAALVGAVTQDAEPRVIDITARRFAFEPSQIDVLVGERVRLMVRSGDGVHGIEIKKFKVNKDVPRGGKPVIIDFTASEAGRFPILCSEYCGDDHDTMTGMLVVQARPETGVQE